MKMNRWWVAAGTTVLIGLAAFLLLRGRNVGCQDPMLSVGCVDLAPPTVFWFVWPLLGVLALLTAFFVWRALRH
jgi:hypothetical protein